MRAMSLWLILAVLGCQQRNAPLPGPEAVTPLVVAAQPPAEVVPTSAAPAAPKVVVEPQMWDVYPYAGPMNFSTDVPCQCIHPVPPAKWALSLQSNKLEGPILPQISNKEQITRDEVAKGWFDAPIKAQTQVGGQPLEFLEASLNPESVANMVRAAVSASAAGDATLIVDIYGPKTLELFDFFELLGLKPNASMAPEWFERMRKQVGALKLIVREYVEVTARKDRLFGQMRVSLVTYKYKGADGGEGLGCIALLMAESAWRLLDLTCDLPPFFPMPEDLPGRMKLDLTLPTQPAPEEAPGNAPGG